MLQTTPENTYIHYNIHTNAKNPKACVRSHELGITQAQRIQERHESGEERAAAMRERQRSDDREDPIAKRDHPEETITRRRKEMSAKIDEREETSVKRRAQREGGEERRRSKLPEAKQAAEARR